jgi:hypothetical protein
MAGTQVAVGDGTYAEQVAIVTPASGGGAVQTVGVEGQDGATQASLTNPLPVTIVEPATFWTYAAAASGIANTTTAVTIKAGAGASVRNYVEGIQLSSATLGGATEFAIRDGAAGTVLWRCTLGTAALPVTDIVFETPLRGSANTLLEIVTLTAVTGGVYCNVQGYTGP